MLDSSDLILILFRDGVSLVPEGENIRYELLEDEEEPSSLDMLRENKKAVIETLSAMRVLGGHIGEIVMTPEGEGILWGVSPYGVLVFLSAYVLTFHPLEILTLNPQLREILHSVNNN